jgi:D-glucosaminate-6-phosphate ammonia-lyase
MRRQSNENVYERLGVRTIVNASGPSTRLSGGILRPEVAAAMAEASQWCVDLAELQARASEVLADATGAESGYVTAGAAAGLMLAAAACVAKLDPARMNRLPDTAGMQNEIIIARSQRNMYDHAVVQAGAKLVEIGIPDRFSGAGVRDTQATRPRRTSARPRSCGSRSRTANPSCRTSSPSHAAVGCRLSWMRRDNCPRPRT